MNMEENVIKAPSAAKVKNGRSTCLSGVGVDRPIWLSMARETSSPSVGSGASPGFCFKKVALQPEVAAKKFGSGAFGQLFGCLAITEGASVNSGSETLFVSIGFLRPVCCSRSHLLLWPYPVCTLLRWWFRWKCAIRMDRDLKSARDWTWPRMEQW